MTAAPALVADLVEDLTAALLAARWPAGGRIVDVDEVVLRERVIPLVCAAVHAGRCSAGDTSSWEPLDDPGDLVSRVCDGCGREEIAAAADLAPARHGGWS